MNEDRATKLIERAKTQLAQKIDRAMQVRLYGEVVVKVTFENGVPQTMRAIEDASFKS